MNCPKCGGACVAVQPRSNAGGIVTHIWHCRNCKIPFEEKDGVKVALFTETTIRDFFNMSGKVKEIVDIMKLSGIERATFEVMLTDFALAQWMEGFKTGIILGLDGGK